MTAVMERPIALSEDGDQAAEILRSLLSPHKVALLAIERQAHALIIEAVMGAGSVIDMFRESRKTIKAVQIVAANLSYSHISQELNFLGFNAPKKPKLTGEYLNRLNRDLRRSLKDPNLTQAQKAQRAGLAAVAAANRAYTDMQLAMYRAIDADGIRIEKVWTTNKTAPTPPCSKCMELDGTVVEINQEFPIPIGINAYVDLQGPPLHPSCRCRLIPRLSALAS